MRYLIITFSILLCLKVSAQETYPVNGVYEKNHLYYAFTNAVIHVDHENTIKNGVILFRDGIIEAVGKEVSLPKGTVITDLKGKHIYPSFIDLYTSYGLPAPKKDGNMDYHHSSPQLISKKDGPFAWNEALRPEYDAAEHFRINEKMAEELRKSGFGIVLSHNPDGIARGTSVLTTLGNSRENLVVLKERAAAHYSLKKGSTSQNYPSSQMGSIALLRQAYLDGEWYGQLKNKKEVNLSLQAWNNIQSLPQIFETNDKLEVLRTDKIGDEFGKQFIIKGSGDEYQRVKEIKATGATLIVPVDFPAAYDVEDPYDATFVSLAEMKHWEMAPANAAILEDNGIEFAFTTSDLKNSAEFLTNVRKAFKYGLSEGTAIKAMTSVPAKLLGVSDRIGSLEKGKIANLIIVSDNIFDEKAMIFENWIQGKRYVIHNLDLPDLTGKYSLQVADDPFEMVISGSPFKPKALIKKDTLKISASLNATESQVTLAFSPEKDQGAIRLSGRLSNKDISGQGQLADGSWVSWSASFEGMPERKDTAQANGGGENDTKIPVTGEVIYPFVAYGNSAIPEQGMTMIKNITVWTNEEQGILENQDVLIDQGKIIQIGSKLNSKTENIIDGTGKHLTPGIIDEHSHIAISKGVNEGSQSITAEVRIGDVVNSKDINIYRQLAGGVTSAQLLHGSANPIGGQAQLIKLRWGRSPEEMKFQNSDPFIKFALGENVKQSNWGDDQKIRFPQTRMGVEQVYYDGFIRAKEYEAEWNAYNNRNKKSQLEPPRKDLELEALVEILNKKRFITCHSYIQSEINMLMHVADSMGFNVNTFTHILEGYKVADKMKEHGVGGSTFSDWWAYKFEVNDAIPYNGVLLSSMGVTTAFNSDDAEMGRRLNQEAAKAVKYGGMSEEAALKLVTLNPAKLLHVDDRVGSIKVGKDADMVIWSDHPLSVYAKAEKTFIDGICYYDADQDKQMREEIAKERNRLINKMIEAKKKGQKTQKPQPKEQRLYHCETMGE